MKPRNKSSKLLSYDAKLILKDGCLNAIIAGSKPQSYDPEKWPYLFRVCRSLRKLKAHLRKVAKSETYAR